MTFEAFIAIDWSGGRRNYRGIAVARCANGREGPHLVRPATRQWTRTGIADWLLQEVAKGQRLLVGLDFAFGFPYEADLGYLGGQARGVETIFDLWSLIERSSSTEPDYGCAAFIADPLYAELFWHRGPRPTAWVERHRQAEAACVAETKTWPDSLYKLLGPKQVGKASLTGIRVLNRLRAAGNVAVWPFEDRQGCTLVEIYPTLFRKCATKSTAKIKSLAVLNAALGHFDSGPAAVSPDRLSDHDGDALISAAGLRAFAPQLEMWEVPDQVRREGWIFGVPPP